MADERKGSVNWSLVCHLSGLAIYIGIPLGNIIAPVIIWMVKKDKDPAVKESGREAINFNASFTLYGLIAGLLCYVLVGFILVPLVIIAHIVLIVQAARTATRGE